MLKRRKEPRPKRSRWRREAPLPVRAPEPLPEVREALERETGCLRHFDTWLRAQACVVGEHCSDPCGPGGLGVQLAHEDKGKGMGMKTDPRRKTSICPKHHAWLGNGIHSARAEIALAENQMLRRLVMSMGIEIRALQYATGVRSWDPYEPPGNKRGL